MQKLGSRTPEEIKEFYNMVGDEVTKMLEIIEIKSGYYTTGKFLLFEDEPKKCMDVQCKIALLERPHEAYPNKVEYYKKINPDNVLNKTVIAHRHNSWYKVYDGVHRTTANEEMGNDTIKVDIMVNDVKK